jgi:hypothetical protein
MSAGIKDIKITLARKVVSSFKEKNPLKKLEINSESHPPKVSK